MYTYILDSSKNLLTNMVEEYLSNDILDRPVLILPNRLLISQFKNILIEKIPMILNLRLYTFDEVIDNTKLYAPGFDEVDELISNIIVRIAIQSIGSTASKNFINSEGFAKLSWQFITDAKNSLISQEILQESRITETELKPLISVFKNYENLISRYRIKDRYSKYDDFINGKLYSGFLSQGPSILIGGFYDFRKLDYRIIETLKGYSDNITIYIPTLKDNKSRLIDKTVKMIQKLGFNKEESKSCYSEEPISNICIVRCFDRYLEIKRLIIQLKKDKLEGIDYENMAVITNDDKMVSMLINELKKSNIPFVNNWDTKLSSQLFFRELVALLDIDNIDDFIIFLISTKEIMGLNHSVITKFNTELSAIDYINKKSVLNRINQISDPRTKDDYLRVIDRIDSLFKSFNTDNSIALLNNIINEIINKYSSTLKESINSCDFWINELVDSLTELKNRLNIFESDVSTSIVKDIISSFILNHRFIYDKDKIVGIKIMDTNMMRSSSISSIYFLNVTNGKFPYIKGINYYDNYRTIELLKSIGFSINSFEEEEEKQYINFLLSFNSALEKCYLSYNTEDNATESDYLTRIKENMGINEENYSLKDYFYPKSNMVTSNDDKYWHISAYGRDRKENYNFSEYHELSNFKDYIVGKDNSILIDGGINIDKLSISSTSLETYQKCSRMYYYRYILKIKDETINMRKKERIVIGQINHKVLEEVYRMNWKSIKSWIDGELIDNGLLQLDIVNTMNSLYHQYDFDMEEDRTNSYIESNSKLLFKLIANEINDSKKRSTKFYPYKFEQDFIIKDIYKSNSGKTIDIVGRIDRVDKDNNGNIFLTDYKSSKSSMRTLNDFYNDKTLQFPIYSLIDNVVGCNYNIINNGTMNNFYYKRGFERGSGGKSLDDIEFNELINSTKEKINSIINRIENGDFTANTTDTNICKYCDYKPICNIAGI